jgi:transposase
MPKRQIREYTKEFKIQAVELATQPGMSVNQAALDLGIPNQTLNTWVRQSKRTDRPAFTGRGVQALTEQEKRIKDLERENAVLRQEREILKAAAKFFVREMK